MQEIHPSSLNSRKDHFVDDTPLGGDDKLGADVAEVNPIEGDPVESHDSQLQAPVVHRKLNARQIQLSMCHCSCQMKAIT